MAAGAPPTLAATASWHRSTGAAAPRPAGLNYRARVLEAGDRPLILLHGGPPGGTILDLVIGCDGELLRLASGAAVLGRLVIAPAEAAIPGAMPYWGGPGAGLWEAAVRGLSTPIREQAEARPGVALTKRKRERMVERLFARAARGSVVIAGRPLPLRPGEGYVAFDPGERAFWTWDFVTEQAFPRPGTGAAIYGAIREIPASEWAATSPGAGRSPNHRQPRKAPKSAVNQLLAGLDGRRPTAKQIEAWATKHGFTRDSVRTLVRERLGEAPIGRRRKTSRQ